MKKITVLGAGSWGTALAFQLARSGANVFLWDHKAERAQKMQEMRQNFQYLPEILFPENIFVNSDLELSLKDTELVVAVTPSQTIRNLIRDALPYLDPEVPICCASKGIEESTLMTMEEVLRDVLPRSYHAQLSFLAGPSFAKEVAQNVPTAVVIASRFPETANEVAEAFHGGYFRVYHTDDIVGAELGGALKNIVAIACGIADGMGTGLNTRAALMTRGLAEITRLAVARGANPLTLAGLAGMGDLTLTCTGNLSRNRRVGIGLGQGKKLPEILDELGQVAEGIISTKSAIAMAESSNIEMPITKEIYHLLYEDGTVQEAMLNLLGRERRAERG